MPCYLPARLKGETLNLKRGIIMFKYAAFAAVMLAGATPAFAADSPILSGFHVEAIAGWDHVKVSAESEDLGKISGSDNGFAYGVGAGYDFLIGGNVILGIEGEVADSSVKECVSDEDLEIAGCVKAGRDLYVGARLGIEAAPGTLVYVKGGYTNARGKLTFDDGVEEGSVSDNFDGFRLGVGVEQRLGHNAFVKAEYRYSKYDTGDLGDLLEEEGIDSDLTRHQVIVGVGFRF